MPVENAGNMLCHRKVMYPLAYVPGKYLQTVRTINKLALPDWFSTATAGMRRVNGVSASGRSGQGRLVASACAPGGISLCPAPDQRCGAPTYSPANAIGIAP
jgi:hypothetical protein